MAEQWRILVVEGEENLNWNIVNSLQKDGYLVLGMTGGAEAIRTLWSEEYDVVICSQQMPDADGFDLLQWMRTYCPNTRMVMLGNGGLSRAQALEQGVASYLEKPVDLLALREELRRLLHQSGFSASLDSFDLLDVIQIINMSHKSIALVVNTGLEEQGTLHFQAGELIWAEYGILRGEEAFYALAAHKNGTVVHRPWSDQITPNVTQPLSRLIFQALQYRSKYAEYQQSSSEIVAIRPGTGVLDPPTLLPANLLDATADQEVDDRPFQFVLEEAPPESSPDAAFLHLMGSSPAHIQTAQTAEGREGTGALAQRSPEAEKPPEVREKAWWEPTDAYPILPIPGNLPGASGGKSAQALQGPHITPATVHKTNVGQQSSLPSWLTDQPTNLHLPVLRTHTGQIPALPPEPGSDLPKTPPASPYQGPGAQWLPTDDLSESGLRTMKREDSMLTNPHRAIRPDLASPSASALRPSPLEQQRPLPGQSGQPDVATPQESANSPLQSLAALQTYGLIPPAEASTAHNGAPPAQSVPTTGSPIWETSDLSGKRHDPALAAALQTLGYSVPGFIAAAVVGLDGAPIAQVTLDDTDISPLCTHLGSVAREALQALASDDRDGYEHLTITTRTRHILLRLIGKQRHFLQVLVTTRESDPGQSLEVMANVEAAITAILQ
ncbi:MAG TPA: response regulator [Ktedonobacteraceae bacterium]|jgi:DNA-binding response OmpR family regulator/predicted regulator of Ras-like GTPase activity (Roadblock/LC7/MglB family)